MLNSRVLNINYPYLHQFFFSSSVSPIGMWSIDGTSNDERPIRSGLADSTGTGTGKKKTTTVPSLQEMADRK